MRIPGASESFHTSPLASFGETIFQSNKMLSSPVANSGSVFNSFPAAKHGVWIVELFLFLNNNQPINDLAP